MNLFEVKIKRIINELVDPRPHERLSLLEMQAVKEYDNDNKLFIEAGSPYPTITGQQKRTEIVLQCPDYSIDWRIECKSRQTKSLIGEIIIELSFVAKIPEKLYCLVFNDVLAHPYILNQIQQEIDLRQLNDRVWYGTAQQFETKLKQLMK